MNERAEELRRNIPGEKQVEKVTCLLRSPRCTRMIELWLSGSMPSSSLVRQTFLGDRDRDWQGRSRAGRGTIFKRY
jgi:hypothetical protein